MKFGKRMRSLACPEWQQDYLDYKFLKRKIKQLTRTSSTDLSQAVGEFHRLLLHEIEKINCTHECIRQDIEESDLVQLTKGLGRKWVLSPSQARVLLLDALQLSQKVDTFRRYIVLNSLAITKIVKKFDKAAHCELKVLTYHELLQQPFLDPVCLERICEKTASLLDRIMMCILPDGTNTLSSALTPCPICLASDVKTPITLSCEHTFCWTCLSKASEHQLQSCPLCRKPQSIDPRDYEIDGLVKRFTHVYSFVPDQLHQAPMAWSPMRQILSEGFETAETYLTQVNAQYASISPRESSKSETEDTDEEVFAKEEKSESTKVEETTELTRGDPVEVLDHDEWLPGMVIQCNDDDTYAVLWWANAKSQRFSQSKRLHELRQPDMDEDRHALFDFAAGAWRSATNWALTPFRRLRSLSTHSV